MLCNGECDEKDYAGDSLVDGALDFAKYWFREIREFQKFENLRDSRNPRNSRNPKNSRNPRNSRVEKIGNSRNPFKSEKLEKSDIRGEIREIPSSRNPHFREVEKFDKSEKFEKVEIREIREISNS